jgi:ankyrin repeat protein
MCEDQLEEHLEEPDNMEIEDSSLDSHENLQLAAYHGNQEAVAVILANGTPIDEVGCDEHGGVPVCTALQAATLSGKESVVRFLIELRANINAPAPPGGFGTALYAAVTTMNEPLVEYLLGQGADPNMTSGTSVSLLEVCYYP